MIRKRVLFVSRTDGGDMRIRKEIWSLLEAGFSVRAYISGSNSKCPLGYNHNNLTVVFFSYKFREGFSQKIKGLLRLNLNVLKDCIKDNFDSIHVVNEEWLISCVFSRAFGKKVILDLFDSIELKNSSSGNGKKFFAGLLSRAAKFFSSHIIVTDKMRLSFLTATQKKIAVVIPNYPSLKSLPDLKECSYVNDDSYSVFVGGSLGSGRGLGTVLKALSLDPKLKVVCAGWIYDDEAKHFIEHDRVTYLGVLEQKAANLACADCMVNIALYEPVNLNNIYASPNKIYDSFCMGQSIVLNSETKLSALISKSPLAFSCSYYDAEGLVEKIKSASTFNKDIKRAKKYRAIFVWECFETELAVIHE